jgi:hypothetical protein
MGRFSLFVGYYGVQGRGGANDVKGWSSIDERWWREERRRKDRRPWGADGGELKNQDGLIKRGSRIELNGAIESCIEVWRAD